MSASEAIMHAIWLLYYPDDAFHPQDPRMAIVQAFHSFLLRREDHLKLVVHPSWDCCYVDVQALAKAKPFEDFEDALVRRPSEVTTCLAMALSAIYADRHPYASPRVISPHFYNLSTTTSFAAIKASSVGQLVSVVGHLTRVSPCRALVLGGNFHCAKCGSVLNARFEDGIFLPPAQCRTSRCYNRFLDLDRDSVLLGDFQRLRLTEPLQDHNHPTVPSAEEMEEDNSRVPRSLDVELRDSLVDVCVAGDLVRLCGVVKTLPQDGIRSGRYGGGGRGAQGMVRESGLHHLYLLVTSIECLLTSGDRPLGGASCVLHKGDDRSVHLLDAALPAALAASSSSSFLPSSIGSVSFCDEELCQIRDVALIKPEAGGPLALLLDSLCPTIFGHEIVKLGLLLALFGGSSQGMSCHMSSSSSGGMESKSDAMQEGELGGMRGWAVRQNIHILLVGDPGLGKSQLLRAAACVSPRSALVTANSCTAAGLTVTLSREGTTGEVCLEAGALLLADRGICFIDELDKLPCDAHALLEAMEQQSVSIAKAGICTSLRSRTSVVAAANPAGGSYNRRKGVAENIKMNAALLTRFDLIFLMVDRPDLNRDEMISEHIFGFAAEGQASSRKRTHAGLSGKENESDEARTLSQRLRLLLDMRRQSAHPRMSTDEMRHYIDYARQYVHPRLSRAAAKVLQRQYLLMRASASQPLPVTPRHLESLIRLAQARARVDLRDEVSVEDAEQVVVLLQECLVDSLTDETGRVDFSRRGGLSMSKQMKGLYAALQREVSMHGERLFSRQDLADFAARLQLKKDIDEIIDGLRTEGYLLLKGPRLYQLNTLS